MKRTSTGARSRVWGSLAASALWCGGASGAASAATAGADEARWSALQQQLSQVQSQLQQLSADNRALRDQQQQMQHQIAELRGPIPGADSPTPTAAAPANASALPSPAVPPAGAFAGGEGARLWGYGEMYYSEPTGDGRRTQADLARAVFGLGYAFDERTEFNSEYEVEHAVASASDAGEFEVEQFYVDRTFSDAWGARAGLFLMPFGLLNEHHEPTHFYGVQRNLVETLIIPSTWREGGVSLHGNTRGGFGWNVGLTTGVDLSKWEFAPQFPLYASAFELVGSDVAPLRATHQELSLANARRLSQYFALSYYGLPALQLGGAISSGESPSAGNPRVTLWEAHARWTPAKFDLSALYARGAISNLAALNAANSGASNPIPSAFYGYFLQGAYSLWERADDRLVPFVRFERYQLGASYSGTSGPVVPAGPVALSDSPGDLGYWPANHDRVWTAGANLYLGAHLVLKGDYQWFEVNRGFRRFDLGLGVSF